MSHRFTAVEANLNRAEFRWKGLRFLRWSFMLGAVVCLLLTLFGAAILSNRISSKTVAVGCFIFLGVLGVLAWLILAIISMASSPERTRLGAALERVDRRLLDRLNTLLFLERRGFDNSAQAFAFRIARQASGLFAEKSPAATFPGSSPLPQFLAFALALTLTLFFYRAYSPWQHLLAAQKNTVPIPAQTDKPLELALPTNNVEQNQNWGEVRITDPGADLKVTKVDVVPLQIEAAANRSLQKVSWSSTINGGGETVHPLPPPSEPRYAVYQPLLYLDELQLSDWDVMTYYAKANTVESNAYGSEVYFLEVRPFREDLLKMPGGEDGKAYQALSQLSGLISRQQQIIRQTHQHLQRPPETENLRAQDRKKLGQAEGDLGDSARHLYAEMAGEMENKPIGEALDNLAKAEKSLDQAARLLPAGAMPEGQNRERNALTELIAARKMFQKAVSDNPEDFEDSKANDASPVADSARKLSQMAEFRNESKAATDFVQRTLAEQRALEQQARNAAPKTMGQLSVKEEQLRQSLADFQSQHPGAFENAQTESQQAQEAMSEASDSLRNKSGQARKATELATRQLEQLRETMDSRSQNQQLANAYRLKQMLDQQAGIFDKRSQPDSNLSDAELRQNVDAARETISQLQKTAELEPTRDAFGPQLRDALSGKNKIDLEASLNRVQQADGEAEKRERSGDARDRLKQVSKAFGESEPKSLQMARNHDQLKSGAQDSLAEALAQLSSLQARGNRPASPRDMQKLAQEALANLRSGLRSRYGSNERAEQIVAQLDQVLKADRLLDVDALKRLMDELQRFSVETSDQLARKEDKPEVSNIDPTRLPPAYRGRIQKYFQKLSEK